MKKINFKYYVFKNIVVFHNHTANEGPVRIQNKCLVPIYIFLEIKLLFPKQNHNILSPSSYTLIYL
jgi:hypothetical protein